MRRRFDLVLASASPRRREMLERLGLVLRLAPVDLDETPRDGERPSDCVRRLAASKCDAAVTALATGGAGKIEDEDEDGGEIAVLGADTMVSLNGEIFGKPGDDAEARAMLGRLAGRRHEVTTAYRVWRGRPGVNTPGATPGADGARVVDRAVTTLVSLRLLKPAEIEAYGASGEWRDKAGGYALQGIAGAFITELRGSHSNVIGLPLAEVLADLLAVGALSDYPRAAFGDAFPAGAT
jgi:septum formation protein